MIIHHRRIGQADQRRRISTASVMAVAFLSSTGNIAVSSTLGHDALQTNELLSQRFLTTGSSIVRVGDDRACFAFQSIDVRTSRYTDPNGEPVGFLDVARSPAAGLWRVGVPVQDAADADSNEYVLRIVLKYPVETLHMQIGSRSVSLTDDLDRAGDSVTLTTDAQTLLQAAFRDGQQVQIIGTSKDTGRTIEDSLVALNAEDTLSCDAFVSEASAEVPPEPQLRYGAISPVGILPPSNDPEQLLSNGTEGLPLLLFGAPSSGRPNHGPIHVSYGGRLPGAPDPEKIVGCRMTDLGGEIERYHVTQVNGFVSQSSEAWITRDGVGEVRQVYIPGVFEALRTPGTDDWTADVSIAAFANNPFEEPIYKGCLGSQSIEMTGTPDALSETVTPQPGLGAGEPFATPSGGSPSIGGSPGMAFFVGGGGSSSADSILSSATGSSNTPPVIPVSNDGNTPEGPRLISPDPGPNDDFNEGEPPGPEISAVPLPFGLALLLSGLGSLILLRRKA